MTKVALREASTLWNLPVAAQDSRPSNMLPSRVGWAAAVGNDELVRVIAAAGLSGFDALLAEQIPMPKMDGATRPAADLPIEDHVVFMALSDIVSNAAFPGLVPKVRRQSP
jgi:hypothetical protein